MAACSHLAAFRVRDCQSLQGSSVLTFPASRFPVARVFAVVLSAGGGRFLCGISAGVQYHRISGTLTDGLRRLESGDISAGIPGHAIAETPIAVLDLETTGLSLGLDRAVEVSVVRLGNHEWGCFEP